MMKPFQPNKEEVEDGDVRRGPWTLEEDNLLIRYIACHGEGRWNSLAKSAGLKRTGKSCRLRWLNYLKPDIKRGNLTPQEQLMILELHSKWGNRWSKIAQHLPGRTDNEIKNYWRTRVQKQAKQLNMESNSQGFIDAIRCFYMPRLIAFPSNGILAPNLTRLTITGCSKLTSLPENMCVSIASLQLMSIENCPQISTFPIGGLPQSLLTLKISSCNKLISDRLNWHLHKLVSLKELEIGGDENVEEIESFPDDQFLLPKSLTKLSINGFKNLKSLNSKGINVLSSLEELKICRCPKVQSFPEDLMIPSLCSVDVSWSIILVSRCRPDREDWHKISHLPRVRGAKGSEY